MPKAAGLADAIRREFNVSATLIEGGGGVFDVHVNGAIVWSKFQTGRFPEPHEVLDRIKAQTARA